MSDDLLAVHSERCRSGRRGPRDGRLDLRRENGCLAGLESACAAVAVGSRAKRKATHAPCVARVYEMSAKAIQYRGGLIADENRDGEQSRSALSRQS